MLKSSISTMRNQELIGISVLLLSLWAAWQIGNKIAGGDVQWLLLRH